MLRTGFVFDELLRTPTYSTKFHTQAYRSGHNEAVLKTVCLTGTGVRIPQPAPKDTNFAVGVFLFFVLNLCAVTMGRRAKTINNYFCEAETAPSNDQAKLNLFLSDAYRLRYIALFVVYDRRIANYVTVTGLCSHCALFTILSNPISASKNNSIVDTISATEFYFLVLKPLNLMVFRVFFLL